MNLRKILLNAFVSCSLISLIYCGSAKPIVENNQSTLVEKEVNYIPYYLKVYEAKNLFEKEDYGSSFKILDSLFKIYKPLNQMMVNEYNIYLESAYLSNNHQIFPEAVVNGIEDFGISDSYFEDEESTMYSVYKIAKIDTIEYKIHWNNYVNKLNLSLRDTIKEMMIRDQYNGRKMDTERDKEIMDSIGQINEKLLVYIFEKYGYPNENLIGNVSFAFKESERPGNYNISPMLKHIRDSVTENYLLPKLLEFVKKGEAIPFFYASTYDKLWLSKTGKQKYGTFTNVEIENKEKIDSIRNSIGLPKL